MWGNWAGGFFKVRQRDLSGCPGRVAASFGDPELDVVGHLDAHAVLGPGRRVAGPLRVRTHKLDCPATFSEFKAAEITSVAVALCL